MSSSQKQPQKQARKSAEEEEADRISALPDSLVIHILSLLPSTRDAMRTSILSKRWLYLWNHVPNLFFLSSDFIDENPPSSNLYESSNIYEYGREQFVHFINNALLFHSSSSRIQKFLINFFLYDIPEEWIPQINAWELYATKSEVKELTLDLAGDDCEFPAEGTPYSLPQFLYSHDSLIELNIKLCDIAAKGKINWARLKILSIGYSHLSEDVVEHVLSGSPVLESLELYKCDQINHLSITSQSLKRLVLNEIYGSGENFCLHISAPYVEDLEILGNWFQFEGLRSIDVPSIDVPSLISCKLDFHLLVYSYDMPHGNHGNIVKQLIEMVHHAKRLKVGGWLLAALSELEMEWVPSQPLDSKVFVMCWPKFCEGYFDRIASLLCNLHELEKLVIDISCEKDYNGKSSYVYESGDNYWELLSRERDFSRLLSHLKTIEIFGLRAHYKPSQGVLPLVDFLIKNGKALEKAIIYDAASFETHSLL